MSLQFRQTRQPDPIMQTEMQISIILIIIVYVLWLQYFALLWELMTFCWIVEFVVVKRTYLRYAFWTFKCLADILIPSDFPSLHYIEETFIFFYYSAASVHFSNTGVHLQCRTIFTRSNITFPVDTSLKVSLGWGYNVGCAD